MALLDHILLCEHVVAFKTAALAFAGNVADPLEGQVLGLGELAGVLDVIPDAIDDLPEFPLDVSLS